MSQRKQIVVGLLGKFNSGKGTAANLFIKHGFKGLALADPIKFLLYDQFDVPRDELWGPSEKRSERTRQMLQALGTDFGRHFDPNIWVSKLCGSIEWMRRLYNEGTDRIVVTDVRFPNEVEMLIRRFNATIVKIHRPDNDRYDNPALAKHESETVIDTVPIEQIHAVINNAGTLSDFEGQIENLIQDLLS